ncbi:MAG: glycosyltransferase family 39 protein [Patescibacteria group bacterium]
MNKKCLEKYKYYFILAGLIGLGIFLRLWEIGTESLRLDEAQSIWQASHTTEFIRFYTLKNVHLPLHNTFLHFWIALFGGKAIAGRISSAIFGILSLPALYLLSREFLKRKWALTATGIGAISPFWIWYSREIRMYTLLTLITVFSYYFFVRIIRTNQLKNYIFYTITNIIGIYTHYFFFLVLLVQAVFFLSTWKVKWNNKLTIPKKRVLYNFTAVVIVLIIAFSPWFYAFINSHGSGTLAPELIKPSSFNIFLSFFEFTFGYQPENITTAMIALWPLVTLMGFVFLEKRRPIKPSIFLMVTGILLPVIFTFSVSILYKPIYLTRYLIIITPFYYIFIAWVLSQSKGLFQKIFISIFGISLIAAFINQNTSPDITIKENYREAINYISGETSHRDIVVLAPPYMIYPFQYYYHGPAQITSIPIWNKRKGAIPEITPEKLIQDIEIIKGNRQRIFLFIADDLKGGLEAKNFLDNKFTKLEKKQFSKTLWLNVYQTEYKQKVYAIKDGDTLSSVAYEFYQNESFYKIIAQANNLTNPDFIEIGQSLKIPSFP